ncbi:glycosyltransferase family 2 protein [Achromobacter xylosoxidans]|uniref:glycosyltransferase family 2 protein n=1 Tax=Alcaligenes xylosoxydans xylosoxydans TaxID=85698 RepID=UPI002925857E|nr:glycosyltransferase family 2 protein [Achromobacter xylosoxidans]BEG76739.1 hypothetical protein HBIAX_03818 [Achromobacter xylosoxidans]
MEQTNVADGVKASVIIPTKNPGPIFARVLDAVCSQTTDFPYDVLVIDSGSTDGTLELVRHHTDPRVRLHEIPSKEFGHGKTRNAAVAMTRGDYAVVITHDALPATDNWLAAMVNAADADPSIAGVFGRHLAYPEANPYTKRDLDRHFQNFVHKPVVWLEDRARYDRDQSYRQYLHFFSDNNALIRRSVWLQLPYPDVDFAEDQIWAQKAIEAGWKKAYSHDGAVFHSHDFPIFETLQRSFDESYALYRLFGYVLTSGLAHLVLSTLRQTREDLAYARRTGIWRDQPRIVLQMPLKNLARAIGHYLGSRAERLPRKVRNWLSRDRRMLMGLPTSTGN